MEEEIQKVETGARKAWPVVMSWVGGITALIGLFVSVGGGVTWFENNQKQKAELQARMALAQAQAKQGEYQASIQSYGDILKAGPLYRPALDQQLDAAMLWLENFDVVSRADQDAGQAAAAALDQIMPILDSGLTRSHGSEAADVQAHIGWAHWLNKRIAEREFGDMDEQNLRAALKLDPPNVYANAMLGAWTLQTGGSLADAVQHFNSALATGKARPFVRKLQLGGLIYLDKKGARGESVKVANDMRKSSETLDEEYKSRILGFCFDPFGPDHAELVESLSAVPPEDAWNTYLWLDDNPDNAEGQRPAHEFIKANLLELSGKREESLAQYRVLQREVKNRSFTMTIAINAAIARLSHS
jgi:tetratricopeptide (TPR) repeat protein